MYEAPGMELLGTAYAYLLQLVLDRRSRELFDQLSLFVAKQIYQGYGFDLGTHMARAAIAPINALATGTIKLKLYKGRAEFDVGRGRAAPDVLGSERQHGSDRRVRPRRQRGLPARAASECSALAANGQVVAPAWATK